MKCKLNEGAKCPDAECDGTMEYPKIENCSCHINPPCFACSSAVLTCSECGHEDTPEPAPEIEYGYRPFCSGVSERYVKNPSTDLGDGKRIFDYDYDGRSGSTMVWRGKYEGPVTADDIINHFGDGTFGHRGPSIYNGNFLYTLITD